jgi:hypothetical protein
MLKNRIVLLPIPFDDLTATKVRPAVCLTNPIGPHKHVGSPIWRDSEFHRRTGFSIAQIGVL